MSRTKNLIFAAMLAIMCTQMMTSTVLGQHGGGCTCSLCSQATAPPAPTSSAAFASTASAPIGQDVFLDFDSGIAGTVNYTQAMRDAVVTQLENIYGNFGVNFTQTNPGAASGPFSTLTFNSGPAGGLAQDTDFRNLNRSDNAQINIGTTTVNAVPTTSELVNRSANVAAHELGHLLGLSHHDAIGPIGSGLPPESLLGNTVDITPQFLGPRNATELPQHVLQLPFLGGDPAALEQPDIFLSERSAIKLTSITQLNATAETFGPNDTIATAQAVLFDNLIVPNTILSGQNAGIGDFDVDAASVVGAIDTTNDVDVFSFEGEAGDLFNFEIISQATNRFFNVSNLDASISIFDADGDILDYFGGEAFSSSGVEFLDPAIFDLTLQESGTFFIQVDVDPTFPTTGGYELFFTRFNGTVSAVPEPSTGMLLLGTGLVLASRRRR